MIDWIPSNPQMLSFVEDHFLFLALLYGILKAMFPESKMLRTIGAAALRIRARGQSAIFADDAKNGTVPSRKGP